ncbi:MAG TPA: hypothetical protein VLN41_01210 [Candidatus Bathyarchaeia archaeon]|nr:hypothetical protein [Candidatus Bathyarchaeia archaeon]
MFLADAIFALGIAFFLTVVFAVLGRRARSGRGLMLFFTVVFLAGWAGGIWITPIGPSWLGVYWLSFFVVGLVFALLLEGLAAFSKRSAGREKMEEIEAKEEREIEGVFNAFLLVLLIFFAVAIVIGYVFHRLK